MQRQMLGKHTLQDGHIGFFALVATVTVLSCIHRWPVVCLFCSTRFLKHFFLNFVLISSKISLLGGKRWDDSSFEGILWCRHWLSASTHLFCAGIKPSRSPPFCLTLKRTCTKVELVLMLQKHTHYGHTQTHNRAKTRGDTCTRCGI